MALKYRRNPFNSDRVCEVLETLARQQDPSSPELGAIEVSAHALLFIFAPPASFVNEEGRIVASMDELLLDLERGHAYVAYLAPWVEEVRNRATDEQREFLREVGLDGAQEEDAGGACAIADEEEEAQPGHDGEPLPLAKTVPEPAHAATLLEALAGRYDPSTAGHTCLELARQTMRFLIDTHQVDAFCVFLDEIEKSHRPTGEVARPALG